MIDDVDLINLAACTSRMLNNVVNFSLKLSNAFSFPMYSHWILPYLVSSLYYRITFSATKLQNDIFELLTKKIVTDTSIFHTIFSLQILFLQRNSNYFLFLHNCSITNTFFVHISGVPATTTATSGIASGVAGVRTIFVTKNNYLT